MPISISLMQDNFTKMFLKEVSSIDYNVPEYFACSCRRTVGRKIIRALEIVRVKKLIFNAVL